MSRWKIFIISLGREEQRREHSLAQILPTGWDFEIVEAVDAAKVSRESLTVPRDAWLLREGEVACYQSHLRAMRRMLDERLDYGIILEDDFIFTTGNRLTLATLFDHLPEGADHVQLHNHKANHYRKYRIIGRGEHFNHVGPTNYGCWAYLISSRFASHILTHHAVPRRPIDDLIISLSKKMRDRFGFHDTVQNLVDTGWEIPSSINRKRLARRSTGLMLHCWLEAWRRVRAD